MTNFKTGDRVRITAPNLSEGVFDGTLGTYVGQGYTFHHVKPDIWPDTDYERFKTGELTKIEEENNMTKINLSTGVEATLHGNGDVTLPGDYMTNTSFLAGVDAVLSSLALKTETDQELQDRIEVLEKNLAYEVAQKIKLAEQLQAATATDLTLEQARWKMHAGIESRCSEEVAAEAKPVIDLVFSSLALEPETRETEVVEFNDGPAFRSKGMVHTLTVAPTSGGWLVTCQDFHGESSCNLPSGDAIKLAQMLHPEAREVTDAEAIVICRRDVPGTVPSWAGKDQIDPCRCVQMKGHDGACVCEHGLGHRPVREVE